MLKKVYRLLSENKLLITLLISGCLIWSLTMVKSGLVYDYGMGFWGPNGHDGIWHIVVINGLSNGSLAIPIFAGETIKNYHIGFDILVAIIHKLTGIPVVNLYFQIIPPVLAFFIGFFVYKFVYEWRGSKTQALLAAFFVYFGGGFGWIITLIQNRQISGESLFWGQQSLSTLINPPYALSLIVMMIGLIILIKLMKTPNNLNLFFLILIFSLLAQVKIYSAVLVLIGLFATGVWNYFKERKILILMVFVVTLIVSVIFLIPTYDLRSGGLIFRPFWFLENLVSDPQRLYWPRMASALANYKLAGNLVKGSLAYSLVFVIFLLGNFGIRMVALPWLGKKILRMKKITNIEIFVFTIIISGILLPMVFIQKGNTWNSIQFFYYSLFFMSIVAGIAMGEFLERKINSAIMNKSLYLLIILVFTVPTLVSTMRHYLPSRPPAMISKSELHALQFLNLQPEGVVLTIPYDEVVAEKITSPPKPLYAYVFTAYVSALSGKTTYLEDEVNLDITGYDWEARKKEILSNLYNLEYLRLRNIKYFYNPNSLLFPPDSGFNHYIIYNKDNILIYKI